MTEKTDVVAMAIQQRMKMMGISRTDFVFKSQTSTGFIDAIMNGDIHVDESTAKWLEKHLKLHRSYWLKYQAYKDKNDGVI